MGLACGLDVMFTLRLFCGAVCRNLVIQNGNHTYFANNWPDRNVLLLMQLLWYAYLLISVISRPCVKRVLSLLKDIFFPVQARFSDFNVRGSVVVISLTFSSVCVYIIIIIL